MKNLFITIGIVLVGALSGILGSLFWARGQGSHQTTAVHEEPQDQESSRPLQFRRDFPKLEQRVLAPSAREVDPSPSAKDPFPSPSAPADLAAETERVRMSFAEKLAKHSAQPTDTTWARSTEGILREGLSDAAKKAGFRTVDISCRTTSCVANLEWDSYEAMHANLHTAYESSHNANCARWALAPDDQNTGGKVTVPLFLDCTDWKSQGSVPLSARTQ
jgi:hypothetical protein